MASKTVLDYLERIKHLYSLIKKERTGTSDEIAVRMHVSRRTVMSYFSELRSLGAVIKYDKLRNTYYFENSFTLYATFEVKFSSPPD